MNFEISDRYLLSPKQKQDAKNAAHKLKFGSPKLVDMLREVKNIILLSYYYRTKYELNIAKEMQNKSQRSTQI